ncbi:MAG TPA: hypothetical protein VMN57_03290 [Anaerolineales bacterium]|nr:hypothetical protein [Anaerolineales bacterium]
MKNNHIKLHNKTDIKAQAQIFTGSVLVCTGLAGPGETCDLPAAGGRYDIYLRNGSTGWELARKLDIDAKSLTLMKESKGWFVITEG